MSKPLNSSFELDDDLSVRLDTLAQDMGRERRHLLQEAVRTYVVDTEAFVSWVHIGLKAAEAGRFAAVEDIEAAFVQFEVPAAIDGFRWTVPAYWDFVNELTYTKNALNAPEEASAIAQAAQAVLRQYAQLLYLDWEGRVDGTRELNVPHYPYIFVCREIGGIIEILSLLRDPPLMRRYGHLNYDLPIIGGAVADDVAQALNIPHEQWMQDWPIEVGDGQRVEEFVAYAENETRSEHRLAAITLILESLHDLFCSASSSGTSPPQALLSRIEALLLTEPAVMGYWLCLEAETGEEDFPVTPWLRSICRRPTAR